MNTIQIRLQNELTDIKDAGLYKQERIIQSQQSAEISVNNKNVTLFSPLSEIDGFLVGGASQSSKNFIDIVKNYYK